jgi:hypothetical protein
VVREVLPGNTGFQEGSLMAIPEYGFEFSSPLEPGDLTPEVMSHFAEHVRQSERTLLRDVLREHIRIDAPFASSPGDEADIFRSIWDV